MLTSSNEKSRYVRSRLLDERLSMAKRGLKGLYKAVVFDAGGSLVNLNRYSDCELLNRIVKNVSEKQVKSKSDDAEVDLVRVGTPRLFKVDVDELKNQLEESSLTINENIYDSIKKLQRQGYKVLILTNNDFWAKSRNQASFEETEDTDNSFDSNQNVTRKSQLEVYERILVKLQVQATACVLIDSLLSNLRAAEQLGITAIYAKKVEGTNECMHQLETLLNIQLHEVPPSE